MRLSRATGQGSLLDVPPRYRLQSNADARNAYGAAAQEIVCAALMLAPIPINGNCEICFDAEDNAGEFYEIKSVHRGSKIVVYDFRMSKEERAGVALKYAVFVHRVRGARDGFNLFRDFNASRPEILVVAAGVIHKLARAEKLQKIKRADEGSRCGYNRKGYCEGYRNLPVARVMDECGIRASLKTFELHGVAFCIPVFQSV